MNVEGDRIHINEWLLPLSWLYGLVMDMRNWLFNVGILKEKTYDIPVVNVGNITVGGSGKTPHVEYLVRLLQDKCQVAVLSRGYRRKSRGYLLAGDTAKMEQLGDEPYQLKQKFPNIYVAVDENRRRGIERLTTDEATKNVDVILLDDAFQHRYVRPGINILLVDYHRLIIYDKLLPAGRLRESPRSKHRADIVIVSKCPPDLKPMNFRVLTKALNLFPYQQLFFSCIDYCPLTGVFSDKTRDVKSVRGNQVLLLTGISQPQQIVDDLKPYRPVIHQMRFRDHHFFTDKDIIGINETFEKLESPKLIITTEKDAVRLKDAQQLSENVKDNLFALPIKVKFMLDGRENLNHKIISYVRKNSRNSILVKEKDDNKPKDSHHSGDRSRTISFRNN